MTLYERDYDYNLTVAAFIALLRRQGGHVVLTIDELEAGAAKVMCKDRLNGTEFEILNDD